MDREITILPRNINRPRNHISAVFNIGNDWYWADLADVYSTGNECMIFKYDRKKEEVSDWLEVYRNRGCDTISEENLICCIREYCSEQEAKQCETLR